MQSFNLNHMKKIVSLTSAAMLLMAFTVNAQDCTYYFPVKKGSTTEMKSYNEKDKLTGSSKTLVTEKSSNSVKYTSESFDAKGKSVAKGDFEVKCENGEFVLDMKQYLKGMDLSAYKDMDVKMDSKNLTIPSKLTAGQKLNDGEMNMKISNQFMTLMNLTIKITNRKVEGFEDVTTPAGTFKCAKITYEIESHVMVTTHSKGIEYISEKAGVVRTETIDEKGNKTGYSVLSALTE